MKRLFLILATTLMVNAQVIEQNINCHQGLIDLTIVDTSNIPGIYHLYYFDSDWVLLQGAYVEFQPDTFYITFSGIGQEIHTFDSMLIEFQGEIITGLSIPCIGAGIEEEPVSNPVVKTEYYNFSGFKCEPVGLYIEVVTYMNGKQTRKKFYK